MSTFGWSPLAGENTVSLKNCRAFSVLVLPMVYLIAIPLRMSYFRMYSFNPKISSGSSEKVITEMAWRRLNVSIGRAIIRSRIKLTILRKLSAPMLVEASRTKAMSYKPLHATERVRCKSFLFR